MNTTTTDSPDESAASRVHALDHLRALAMLAGVLFHAALAYSPLLHPWWPAADRQHSPLVDALVWLLHLVRMPLFFLVAGYFAASVAARRGMGGLARQRARRILLPFLVAWPLVHFTIAAATGWALANAEHPPPLLLMLREWQAMPDPPAMPPSTGHLWFLYYLLLFGVLHWAGRALELGGLLGRWMAWGILPVALSLPWLLWPGFALTQAPHPAPEGLLPQFWAIGVYGPFYALGVALHGRLGTLDGLRRWLFPAAAACLVAYLAFWLRIDAGLSYAHADGLTALLESVIAGWGTLACLVLGLRTLAAPRVWLSYLARSAYWTYLLHLPLLFAIQYLLMDLSWPWPAKFVCAVAATLALCLSSYELLVRRTALRRWVG
ncbi:MAG: acyltransferase family protein [Rhodanobacteraceae bacterium]|nr:acyltransferase family protein [Rhodanobacteraceae bacterium]